MNNKFKGSEFSEFFEILCMILVIPIVICLFDRSKIIK